jgi:7-cyano-7-deazaguanine synthase
MKILLFSGGLESTALAYGEKPDLCLTVDYGQPALIGEIHASKEICNILHIKHKIIATDAYDHNRKNASEQKSWWPNRNQLLISIAAAFSGHEAESYIYIGLVKDDVYSDCKPDFLSAMNKLLEMQESRCQVIAPGINLSTLNVLHNYKVPYNLLSLTLSCHTGPLACGQCNGCKKSRTTLSTYKRRSKFSLVDSEQQNLKGRDNEEHHQR